MTTARLPQPDRDNLAMTGENAGLTLMLVEDNTDIREVFAAFLEQSGFQVIQAADGDAALRLLRSGIVPDLILLDLIMPIVNGWQFLRHQREDQDHAAIPVLVISGAPQADRDNLLRGVSGYLKKPLHLRDLLSAVEKHTRH
jgi:CheY-like chemotaxis protein